MNNVVVEEADHHSSSSGCESGWTLYLEHSTHHQPHHFDYRGKIACDQVHHNQFYYDDDEEEEEEEEEDLSMVSDASSGPPHFDHHHHHLDEDVEETEVFCYYKSGETKSKTINLTHRFEVQDFSLDDTASSPIIFSSTKKKGGIEHAQNQGSSLESMIDYSSQGFSATHFQRRSSDYQDQRYGYLQSPFSTEQYQQNQW